MFDFLKRWFGMPYTQYQPGTGRIVAARHDSATGVQVTTETALSIPAIFHGLRTFGQTIGMMDWDVVHHIRTKNVEGIEHSQQEIARNHPVHVLLHSEPNEFQNASEWRECMMAHAIATGGGFSYIERNGNWRPTALLPLLPDRTKAVVTNGQLSYLTLVNGQTLTLDPWEVFHVKGFSWNGVSGLPLIELMKRTLGLDLAQSEFASAFYRNGANAGGVFTYPGVLSDTARQNIKSSMAREYGGIGNAFRTLFVEEGMKFEKLSVDPDKAQFIEGRQYSLNDLARVIGLAPHLLYDLSRSTNNNIEHQGIEAVQYSFAPWANKLCQEANRKLLYESEKWEYSTRIDLKPLMAGDAQTQAQVDTARFNALALTPNEIRAKDGRNPIEGGDSIFLNTTYLPLEIAVAKATAPTPTTPPLPVPPAPPNEGLNTDEEDNIPDANPAAGVKPADNEPGPEVPAKLVEDERAAWFAPVIRDAIGRLNRRETKAIESAINRPDFRQWFATWSQDHRNHAAEVLQPVRDAAAAAGVTINHNWIDRHLTDTSRDIDAILGSSAIDKADAKWSTFNRWTTTRIDDDLKIMGEHGDTGETAVSLSQ